MRLKALRMLAGFKTQEDLAKKLNVSRATISNWENGLSKPPTKFLKKMAELLNCTFD